MGSVQDEFAKQQKSPKGAASSELSLEARIRQEEGIKLESIGIKAGVAVDIRLEWPPGNGKKKWVATTVRRVSKKKGYFKTELDAEAEQDGGMRFYVGEMDTQWRFPKLSSSAGPSKSSSAKQNASKEVGASAAIAGDEPYVGARIEVLFEVDGKQDWYGGKIIKKEKQAGKWLARFDDGDEESITWPDPKGEVRICSIKKKRSSAKASKEEKEVKAEKGKNAQGSLLRLHVGDLCRVLFDDGIRYLGVVTGKDPECNESIIVFEDGEEHRVVLPDKDVFEASRDEALAQWVEEHGESKPIPWWCSHPIAHAFEDGELDIDVPENWSRVLVRPPVKPKRSSSKSRKKAKEAASAEQVDSAKADAGGDQEMVDGADGAEKKKSAKRHAKSSEDAGGEEAGKDLAKSSKDNKQKKKDAMEVEGQGQAGERPQKRSTKPRDRAAERRNRQEREILSKAQSQCLAELENLLLQETPDEIIDDDDITDFVDAWCVYMPQSHSLALNHKDFCLMCGSSPTKEEVLFCRDCGECFHHACAVNSKHRKIPKEKRHMWRCPACRICEVCNGEENWESMLCCDGCDRGFHTYCLKPALKAIPDDGWKCNDCVHCVSCGLKQIGTRKDIWRKDCTLCIQCFHLWEKGTYCPICKVVWRKEERDHRAVQCDTCNKWVHPRCGGFDDAKYKEMEEAEEPVLWNCPKCTGDLEASDEEENDKKYVLPSGSTVLEVQRQFEEFCRGRIKMLQRICEAMELAFHSDSPQILDVDADAQADASATAEQAEIAVHREARPAPDAVPDAAQDAAAQDAAAQDAAAQDAAAQDAASSAPQQDAVVTTTATSSSLQREPDEAAASAMECESPSAAKENADTSANDVPLEPAEGGGEDGKVAAEDAAPMQTEEACVEKAAAVGQHASEVSSDAKMTHDDEEATVEAAPAEAAAARADGAVQGKQDVDKADADADAPMTEADEAQEEHDARASAPLDKTLISSASHPLSEASAARPAGAVDVDVKSPAASAQRHATFPCAPAESIASATIDAKDPLAPKLQALKAFALKHGHLDVRADDGELGAFVKDVCAQHKAGRLAKEHHEYLEKVGLNFDAYEACSVGLDAASVVDQATAQDIKAPAFAAGDAASKVDDIAVAEFEAAAQKCTPEERAEKLVELVRLKKDLVKLEKAVDKHKYLELVPFFDDVLRLLSDEERFSSIPKEVQRMRAQTVESMPDAAKRSRLTEQQVRQPKLVGVDRHWARQDQLSTANSHAKFLQQMLPSMQEFAVAHAPAGAYPYDARAQQYDARAQQLSGGLGYAAPVQRKKPPQKQMPPLGRHGSDVTGDGAGGGQRPPPSGNDLLNFMSVFYGRVKRSAGLGEEVHDALAQHFQSANWSTMTIQKLRSFIEATFKGNQVVLHTFYDVFREHLPAEEQRRSQAPKPQQEHAAWFCAEVRRVYGSNSPTYRGFIQTMNNYATTDKDTLGTIRAIKQLFADTPNLIVEFANFVPETFKKYCIMDKPTGKRKTGDSRAAGGAGGAGAGTALLATTSPKPLEAHAAYSPTAAQHASVAAGPATSSVGHTPGVAQGGVLTPLQRPLSQHAAQQQQQQQFIAKYQELLNNPGPDAKKRKGEADGMAASGLLIGHSLSAMSEQYQRHQQQQQQALLQQVQRQQQQPPPQQQQQPATSQQMQMQLQCLMQDPSKALQTLQALAAMMPGAKAAGAGGGAAASSPHRTSGSGPSLLQTSPSKPALGAQASMPPLLPSGQGGAAGTQQSHLATLMQMLQTQSTGAQLGHTGHQMGSAISSASVLTGTTAAGAAVASPAGVAQHGDAAHAIHAGLPNLSSVLLSSSTHAQPAALAAAGAQVPGSSVSQLLSRILPPERSGAASVDEGGVPCIPQMDGQCLEEVEAHEALPQLDGADVDMESGEEGPVPTVAVGLDAVKTEDLEDGVGNLQDVDAGAADTQVSQGTAVGAGSGSQEMSAQGHGSRFVDDAAGAAGHHEEGEGGDAADASGRGKRISKAKEAKDFMTEAQIKDQLKRPEPRSAKADTSLPPKHQEQLKFKKLIQQASEKPSTQEVQISGKVIRQPTLLAAIREKGMEDGNIVWAQLATAIGIDTKRNHNYSVKLLLLLEGRVGEGEDASKKKSSKAFRPKADKSKGISKRPAPKGKVPIILSSRMAQSRSLEAESKDQSSIRRTEEGGYVTLKLLTGESASSRDEFVHFLPKTDDSKPRVHRTGGVLERKFFVRRAAAQAHRLWVQTILESVKRSEALQERLNRQRMAKLTNVEGWDKKKLGRLIEAAAVGLGLFYWSQAQLCYANLRPERLAELGVLSEDRERTLKRSLGQVHREINKDPRLCSLCRIVGDTGVQGRLLYVERETWAHVNCLCWSKSVYELGIHRNVGKIGMLCNVHHVLQQARASCCDFCGCPGATVACASPGCCCVSHFGCAILNEWSFYSEGRAFCENCTESPAAEALGGVNQSWAPIHLYKLTSRHLRVMPRTKPKLLEAFVREAERPKKGASHSKKRKAQSSVDLMPAPTVEASQLGTSALGPLSHAAATGSPGHGRAAAAASAERQAASAAHMGSVHSAGHAGEVQSAEEQGATGSGSHGGGRADLGESSKRKSEWEEFKDRETGRTYYHNFATKESVWVKPAELLPQPLPRAGLPESSAADTSADASHQSPANLGHSSHQAQASSSAGRAGVAAIGKEPFARLKASIENGQFDGVTLKRLHTIDSLLKRLQSERCITLTEAPAPEDNCILGWSSFDIVEQGVFWQQLGEIVTANENGIWSENGAERHEDNASHAHGKALVMMTDLLKKIRVSPTIATKVWEFDKEPQSDEAGGSDAVRSAVQAHSPAAAGRLADAAAMNAAAHHRSGGPTSMVVHAAAPVHAGVAEQASGLTQTGNAAPSLDPPVLQRAFPTKAARERARAAEAAVAEAAQREREEALNREQWDAYENNLLTNIAQGMQEGSIMARIGSLTVRRLGKIRVDDDSYHSELAIYPMGYMSSRVCFAPGEVSSKNGGPCRRAVYVCQILAGEQGGPPIFMVTVENEQFMGASASEAWERATRRTLRYPPTIRFILAFISYCYYFLRLLVTAILFVVVFTIIFVL